MTAAQALAQIMNDDGDDVDGSDYGNESDFESKYDGESVVSSESDSYTDMQPTVAAIRQAPPPPQGQVRGRGCGRGIVRAHAMNIPPPWTLNTTGFVSRQFMPNRPTGQRISQQR